MKRHPLPFGTLYNDFFLFAPTNRHLKCLSLHLYVSFFAFTHPTTLYDYIISLHPFMIRKVVSTRLHSSSGSRSWFSVSLLFPLRHFFRRPSGVPDVYRVRTICLSPRSHRSCCDWFIRFLSSFS